MPKTLERWERIISRIELNFGEFFKSIPQHSPILDIGCGVGYLEYYLLKRGFTNIDAVDLSEEQIEVAKNVLQEHGFDFNERVTFHLVDVFEYLRKTEKRYKAIAMIDFLDHLSKDKIIEILGLSNNTLQADGLLFLRVTNADNPMWGRFFFRDFTHETPFTPDTLWQCLTVTGFEIIKITYEALPPVMSNLIAYFKEKVRYIGLWILGRFLGVNPKAFVEDLIAIGRKR